MTNIYTKLVVIVCAMFAALWGVSYVSSIQDTDLQLTVAVSVSVVFLAITLGRSIPIDMRLMAVVTVGYCFAGKGFAYVSPAPPIYIGEIVLALASIMFLYRYIKRPFRIFYHPLQRYLVFIFLFGLLKAYIDFRSFGLLAVRDYAMIYYSIYFYLASMLFLKNRNDKIVIVCMFLGVALGSVDLILTMTGVTASIVNAIPFLPYQPHNDIMIPCVVTCLVAVLFTLMEKPRILLILLLFTLVGLVVMNKLAYIFTTVVTISFAIFCIRKMKMIKITAVFAAFGSIALAVILLTGIHKQLGADRYGALDDLERFSDGGKGYEKSTSEWRIVWWETIYDRVMEDSPMIGMGFGADISSEFYYVYYGKIIPQNQIQFIPRYPHGFLFTVLGRTGIVGVILLVVYLIICLSFLYIYAKIFLKKRNPELKDIIFWSFVVAGLANAFVQANFEAPYAAIPHWVCLGWMMARYIRYKKGDLEEVEVKGRLVLR